MDSNARMRVGTEEWGERKRERGAYTATESPSVAAGEAVATAETRSTSDGAVCLDPAQPCSGSALRGQGIRMNETDSTQLKEAGHRNRSKPVGRFPVLHPSLPA